MMPRKTTAFPTALFLPVACFLSACVTHSDERDFDKRQAAKARIELGLGYLAQQNPEAAKPNLDKALVYAPDYYLTHSALAYYYQLQGETTKAEQAYLNAIRSDRRQGDTYNNYGAFLCAQGRFSQAYEQFNAALTAPNYYRQADTYENAALCALADNNPTVYNENLMLLEKTEPVRAAALKAKRSGQ